MTPFPQPLHPHTDCVRLALDTAERKCRDQGARFTALRRRVLELVWGSHEPVGAYTLLEALRSEGHSAAPPTVYRALDFLLRQDLIHRLERRNAFIGCADPAHPHAAQFLICVDCGRAAELNDPAIGTALSRGAEAAGFRITAQTVEIEGLCADCQGSGPEH
ncbi:MAG TPA: transcriptional repressor [Rhodospirillaceae bacterium]|nr:transcriptional repressor [Rhodospirillaceae bacterium]